MERQLYCGVRTIKQIKHIAPIRNEFNKPAGGIWTSTYTPKKSQASEWLRWCRAENFRDRFEHCYIITVKPSAKIYTINSHHDLEVLFNRFPLKYKYKISVPIDYNLVDFKQALDTYDGIHLTDEGQWDTRRTMPLNLYGWDVESTIWSRPVFSSINPINFRKICRDNP